MTEVESGNTTGQVSNMVSPFTSGNCIHKVVRRFLKFMTIHIPLQLYDPAWAFWSPPALGNADQIRGWGLGFICVDTSQTGTRYQSSLLQITVKLQCSANRNTSKYNNTKHMFPNKTPYNSAYINIIHTISYNDVYVLCRLYTPI